MLDAVLDLIVNLVRFIFLLWLLVMGMLYISK